MNAAGRQADPVEAYVTALTAALHGPAGSRPG